MHDSLHLAVIIGRVVEEYVCLAGLDLLERLDETCDFLLRGLLGTVISDRYI